MSTYTQILYHIIYSTKNRRPALDKTRRKDLYKYIWGIIKNKKCHLYQIGGVEDHLHIVTHMHPLISLSSLVKDIKLASSDFIKSNKIFTAFDGWQKGYAAFTNSIECKEKLIHYVQNQEEHHRKVSFQEELKLLLEEHKIKFDEKIFM